MPEEKPKKVHVVNMRRARFPTFAVVLLIIGVIWLLNDLNIIEIDIPWIPVALIVAAIGMIFNRFVK